LHIDFGDCFEASMHREKFPERVPFRLTRMLVKAMEVSGIEGNFIGTCQRVITVLRSNKDSVLAMLEAFVHDPLINWRLLANQATEQNGSSAEPSSNANSTANNSGSVTPAAGTSSAKSSPLARHTISRDAEEPSSNNNINNDTLVAGDGSSGSGSATPGGSDVPSGQSSRAPSRTPPPKTPTIPENESFHADLDEKSKAVGVDSRTNTADFGHNSSSRLDSGSDDLPRTGQKPGAAPMFMDTPSGQVPVSSSVMGATALHAQYENMREFGGGGGMSAMIGTDMNILGGVGDPTNVSVDESEHGDANDQDRSVGGNHQQHLNHHSTSYAQRVMHQQLGASGDIQHQNQHAQSSAAAAVAAVAAAAGNYGSRMNDKLTGKDGLIEAGSAVDGINDNEDNMVLNDRAVSVMQRMNDKLTGKDGLIEAGSAVDAGDSVEHQVRRLIEKAMNHENLCTSYIGWCSFW
jgi:hypothetical protein